MQLLERKKRERKARPYLSANWCLVKEEGAFYLTKPHKYLENGYRFNLFSSSYTELVHSS